MKEIQGKIKFLVVELTHKPIGDVDCVQYPKELFEQYVLSQITEEQAAEFVETEDFLGYFKIYGTNDLWVASAKESLISLLKVNGIKCKLTEKKPEAMLLYNMQRFECTADEMWRCREYNELPDDLLLIKLT